VLLRQILLKVLWLKDIPHCSCQRASKYVQAIHDLSQQGDVLALCTSREIGTVNRFKLIAKLLFWMAILSSAISVAGAAPPGPLTSLGAIHRLTNVEATQRLPAFFEATVTYFRWFDNDLFVQDGDIGVFVHATTNLKLVPGDRVLVRGTTRPSFRPYIESTDIVRIGHGALPKPSHPTYEQMIRAETDCKLVTARAVIRSADFVPDARSSQPTIYLHMLVEGAPADASIDIGDENALNGLLDAEVEITGAVSGHFDNKMQQTGILFHVQSLDGVRILKRASSDPWSLPITPMDRVITGYKGVDQSQRMHVQGTITYYQPGAALVLQDGSHSLWIATRSFNRMQIGDRADAIGFPDVLNGFLSLTGSEVRDSSTPSPVQPPLLAWRDIALGGNDAPGRAYDLVSIEGKVMAEVRESTEDAYVIDTGGHLVSAILRHPGALSRIPLLPMKKITSGSRIRVTGICILSSADPFHGEVPFDILIRSPDDMVIVAGPDWLNTHNVVLLATWLLILVLAIGMRGWYLESKDRRKIGSLAYLEQRRGRILEDINHSKPLAGILERITELASVRLNGAACWCQLANGAMLGNRPAELSSSLRTVEQTVAARSGPPLGNIYATFSRRIKPSACEKEALEMAAELATLAIETSRLYSDLVHRSEFDLLTDVRNRFAMEKTLNAQIQIARQSAGVIGLIYIDLNEFKQVNDAYGHHAGDQYLQELTRRLKAQLRPGDTLARLGGDEFAVLVSRIRFRADLEEIAARLQSCFDEPFAGEGYELRGSASIGIALYPQDANSASGLIRAADAAMYAIKYTRSGKSRSSQGKPEPSLVSSNRR